MENLKHRFQVKDGELADPHDYCSQVLRKEIGIVTHETTPRALEK